MTIDDGKKTGWLAGGAATFLIFMVGLFLKEQEDITAIMTHEKDHTEADEKEFNLLQVQIDRRLATEDVTQRQQNDAIEKSKDIAGLAAGAIAENKAQVDAIHQSLSEMRQEMGRVRTELTNNLEIMDKRIEELGLRLSEIQRQVSSIEGKLGESVPDKPPRR